ncbi:MAG: coproporphyrinogen III oxidase, partial [Cyanobacteria bacterium J06643_5]
IDCEVTTPREVLLETLMLGLRLAEGVNLQKLIDKFDEDKIKQVLKILQPYIDKGWVQVVNGRLKLQDPDGFLFSNVILAKLFETL